ncbi:DUF4138 domain-containing protein [Flagellimonas okinawensis]|uniref:DUF4138 domain-containing protein n=1 Tax=Flagellimonas okinawensis TaxID=3031324 RepID=A0ABT5XSZ6_9FLAO|nr:DUF4138 domain-containing protein [[Muricauda] okinawensis]MDF0709037.1 DUF4138 domain-containing protein [[Muricauda] okinawensis]
MKILNIFFIVWTGLGLQLMSGQHSLDTIYVNEHQTVALFFPSPIHRAVTGDERFVFSYDRESAGHLGLLQGVAGTESNLLVVTGDGKVYAYILAYGRSLPRLNIFIDQGTSIGQERPEVSKDGKDPLKVGPGPDDGRCKFLLDNGTGNLGTVRSSGIRLRLEKVVYDRDRVYLRVGIRNRSEIDFEMDRLDFFYVNGNKRRRTSYQEVRLLPLSSCTGSTLIKGGKQVRWDFVLPKFVLGKGESLKLILEEHHGNRRLVLMTR